MEGGEDLHLTILSNITIPLNYSLPSPAELLNFRKFRCLMPLQIKKQNHIQQYRKVMQHQKHEEAKCFNKSAKDLPSLRTGDAVYVQLVPNLRRWIPATVIERISTRSYKVKAIKGGIDIILNDVIKSYVLSSLYLQFIDTQGSKYMMMICTVQVLNQEWRWFIYRCYNSCTTQ